VLYIVHFTAFCLGGPFFFRSRCRCCGKPRVSPAGRQFSTATPILEFGKLVLLLKG